MREQQKVYEEKGREVTKKSEVCGGEGTGEYEDKLAKKRGGG